MIHPIYFIRHGETDWNAEGRLQGQRDIPLNDLGRVQASECGGILASLGVRVDDLAYRSSPLSRAVETMERVREAAGLHSVGYRSDDRLRELNFGEWEGLTWREAEARDPGIAGRRIADKWHVRPPGGENYVDLAARVEAAIATLDRPSVIVAHGGVGRALFRLRGGLSSADAAERYIQQGAIYLFEGGRCEIVKTRLISSSR